MANKVSRLWVKGFWSYKAETVFYISVTVPLTLSSKNNRVNLSNLGKHLKKFEGCVINGIQVIEGKWFSHPWSLWPSDPNMFFYLVNAIILWSIKVVGHMNLNNWAETVSTLKVTLTLAFDPKAPKTIEFYTKCKVIEFQS